MGTVPKVYWKFLLIGLDSGLKVTIWSLGVSGPGFGCWGGYREGI